MMMKKPQVIMIAGANGSGKTTFAKTLLPKYVNISAFLNADEIAKGLSPFNPEAVATDAGRIMLIQLKKVIHSRQDFVFETTGAGAGHLKTLKNCRESGYNVNIIYLYIKSYDLAEQRVAFRVTQGGHNVNENDIKRRYYNGMKRIFLEYAQFADRIEVFDNSDGALKAVASKIQSDHWRIESPEIWNLIQETIYK